MIRSGNPITHCGTMTNLNFAIFINTTDAFEDCWAPFFKLLKIYWPEYSGRIYLNTEEKSFACEGLDIVCIQSGLTDGSWSKCLDYGIRQIEEDSFIYMQEDYFFHSDVNHDHISELHKVFESSGCDCLHLTDQCTKGPFDRNTFDIRLWAVEKGASYRVSTQAAFWKKESLIKVIRPWETGWEFEQFGTRRSCKLLSHILCVNQDLYTKDATEILPYIFTGIIKGKWKQEVVALFKINEIQIDFSKRGFVESARKNWIDRFKSLIGIIRKYIKNSIFELLYNK